MTPERYRRKSDQWTAGAIVTGLLGGMFLLGGGVLFIRELQDETRHTAHLAFAFGAAIFGALMIRPDPVTDRLKRMAGVARSVWRPSGQLPPSGGNDAGPG
jgi:hypothetical protein